MAIELWSAALQAPPDVVRQLWSTLADDERVRASRFATELLKTRYVIGRGVLRMLLAGRLGCSPSSLTFGYGPAGKPFVCGRPIVFNMSHSGSQAVIAICDRPEVVLGIDIEAVREMPDLHDVAQRFFAPRERDDLASVERHRQTEAFFNCWTRKEAYLKAVGSGLLAPLDAFEVTLRPDEQPLLRHIGGDTRAGAAWRVHHFELPGHIGALVHRGGASVAALRELHPAVPPTNPLGKPTEGVVDAKRCAP